MNEFGESIEELLRLHADAPPALPGHLRVRMLAEAGQIRQRISFRRQLVGTLCWALFVAGVWCWSGSMRTDSATLWAQENRRYVSREELILPEENGEQLTVLSVTPVRLPKQMETLLKLSEMQSAKGNR